MKLELLPALRTQRELYNLPRGFERFWEYIKVMTGGTDDLVLPITGMNPMGRDHKAARLDMVMNNLTLSERALFDASRVMGS